MASIPYPAAPSATLLIPAPPPKNDNVFSRVARTPYPAWTASALLLAAVPPTVKLPLGFPHLVQLPLFAMIFGGSGYMIQAGDPLNGAGTTTAWSLTYLFLHGKKALVSRRPAPILLSSAMAANAVLYGVEYFVNS